MRIGLFGVGYWGEKYLRVLNELPGLELVFVVDTDRERLENLSTAKSLLKYDDPEDALDSCGIDAAVVVTPASTHRRVVRLCLESGAHVMVEKPLALSLTDALELASLSKRLERVLYPGHIYGHNDAVRALGKMVQEDAFGELRYVTCVRTGLGPVRADVNALWDLVPHDLTILHCLGLGNPEMVRATGSSFLQHGVEDVVFCNLRYPSGAVAHVQASWLDPYKIRRVTVVGSKRMAIFDDVASEDRLKVYERGIDVLPTETFGEFKSQVRSGDIHIPFISAHEPLRNLLGDFVEKCRKPETASHELEQGISIVSILEALNQSMGNDGSPIRLESTTIEQYATTN